MVNKIHKRNTRIDIAKGILIILVIVGHLLLGTLNENIVRYVIYSFHMPIFLFISGYLFNVQKLESESVTNLFRKYLSRMIIPWVIAIVVYSLIEYKISIFEKGFSIWYHPFYHLWYVPAFLSYIFCTYFFVKFKFKIKNLLLLLFPATIFLNFIYISPGVNRYFDSNLIAHISYLFRPQFYFYFILGVFLKNNIKIIDYSNFLYLLIAFFLFAAINVSLFFYNIDSALKIISAITSIFQNTLLGLMLVMFINFGKSLILHNQVIKRLISWLGKESLGIYLWHILPILLAKDLFLSSPPSYYVASVLLLVGLLGIIYLVDKNTFLRAYFLGKI